MNLRKVRDVSRPVYSKESEANVKEGATLAERLGAGHRSAGAGRDAGVRAWSNTQHRSRLNSTLKKPGPQTGDIEAQ